MTKRGINIDLADMTQDGDWQDLSRTTQAVIPLGTGLKKRQAHQDDAPGRQIR